MTLWCLGIEQIKSLSFVGVCLTLVEVRVEVCVGWDGAWFGGCEDSVDGAGEDGAWFCEWGDSWGDEKAVWVGEYESWDGGAVLEGSVELEDELDVVDGRMGEGGFVGNGVV